MQQEEGLDLTTGFTITPDQYSKAAICHDSLSVSNDGSIQEVLSHEVVEVLAVPKPTVVHLTGGTLVVQLVVLTGEGTFPGEGGGGGGGGGRGGGGRGEGEEYNICCRLSCNYAQNRHVRIYFC